MGGLRRLGPMKSIAEVPPTYIVSVLLGSQATVILRPEKQLGLCLPEAEGTLPLQLKHIRVVPLR